MNMMSCHMIYITFKVFAISQSLYTHHFIQLGIIYIYIKYKCCPLSYHKLNFLHMPTEKLRQILTTLYCIHNVQYLPWLWVLKEFWMAQLSLPYVPLGVLQELQLPPLQLSWSKTSTNIIPIINAFKHSWKFIRWPCSTSISPRLSFCNHSSKYISKYFLLCKVNCISLYSETPISCPKLQMQMLNLAPHRTYPTTDILQIDRDFFTGAKLLSSTNAKAITETLLKRYLSNNGTLA